MTIESLIEELEQIIDEGKSVPFTSNQIVDVERLRTTIEDMRLNMPDELMQARKIASERKEILTAAQSTAEGIITAAKKKADELISEHEITKGAEAEAENIMAEARKKANGIVEQARGTAAELTEQAQKWSKIRSTMRGTHAMTRGRISANDSAMILGEGMRVRNHKCAPTVTP